MNRAHYLFQQPGHVIHKHEINLAKHANPINGNYTIDLPKGAKIVEVALQFHKPVFWYICDPEQPMIPAGIHIVATGAELPKTDFEYCGHFALNHGRLIFHVLQEF